MNDTVRKWREIENARFLNKQRCDVCFSPVNFCYIVSYQEKGGVTLSRVPKEKFCEMRIEELIELVDKLKGRENEQKTNESSKRNSRTKQRQNKSN